MSQPQITSKKVWLVTGSNRGIGFALVSLLSQRDDVIVFAGIRDPANAVELNQLVKENHNVHLVKLSSGDEREAEAVVEQIERVADGLDYVIANAGINNSLLHVNEMTRDAFDSHIGTNAWGTILLFQKVHRLLIKRPQPVFAAISSITGSNIGQKVVPAEYGGFAAYGMSKTVINWAMSRLATEHKTEGIITLSIHPGVVMTDMVKNGIKDGPQEIKDYMQSMSITPEQSAKDILSTIERATPDQSGGFYQWSGEQLPF
ncbi:hypothetical protein PROFUN_05245 [Planoprotostelium fungivorum]|uniref:Short-chain dehydrogenase/reductase SDR n=1 Tax=Planoprotostelium fungivorum TaxID=1890364 RepID=A0A2P6NR73_9EUKA|nr:hypothetical protein PROFUN_05245 [Planoprotostelium fungivorum]